MKGNLKIQGVENKIGRSKYGQHDLDQTAEINKAVVAQRTEGINQTLCTLLSSCRTGSFSVHGAGPSRRALLPTAPRCEDRHTVLLQDSECTWSAARPLGRACRRAAEHQRAHPGIRAAALPLRRHPRHRRPRRRRPRRALPTGGK
jgi:hypothetical protein